MSQSVQFIDTHAHLHLTHFDADRKAVIEQAQTAGVQRMVEIGYDLVSSRAAIQLAEQYDEIYAVVGVQPHYATEADETWIAEIQHLAQHPKVVAVGEIGLDYYHDRAPHDKQEHLFREQLALARETNLPVVIHSRDAEVDTVRILHDAARNQPGIMHSFSGDWAYAEACLEVGFYLSFSGPVTFRKATELHQVAQQAPLNRILTETDSPYLSPHPFRGKRNEPARVRLVTERIAELRAIPVADMARAVWHNANTIFKFIDS